MRRRVSAFEMFLRTGRRVPDEPELVQTKFNPWHDPDDGRFTFARQGRYFGGGSARSGEGGTRRVARASAAARNGDGSTARIAAGSPTRSAIPRAPAPVRIPKPKPLRPAALRPSRSISGVTPNAPTRTGQSALARKPRPTQSPLGSTASTLKAAAAKLRSGESRLVNVGGIKVVQFGPGVELVPVAVASVEEFSAATAQGSALFGLDAVITGPQFEVIRGSRGLIGQVVVNGRIIGNPAPDRYYMATIDGANGIARLTFGKGDPPSRRVATGIGGAVPLLINGRAVPGYNKAWQPYLENVGTGKNIVAYNSRANTAALFIQPDGASGYSVQTLRAYIGAAGYDYAVLFDGSGSTSLRFLGKAIVKPDLIREVFIPLGIGFRAKGN